MKKKTHLKINPPREHFHLQWHITERCNLRCTHCYMDQKLIREEMGFDAIKNILHQHHRQIGEWGVPRSRNRISFTGGEPFFRKDFFDILQECYANHGVSQYGILCNGFFLTDENVSRLKSLKVDYIQVSIEGLQKTNDSIRGQGSFKKAVEGLLRLADSGIRTSISMTVHKKNIKEVPAMLDLAKRLKVDTLGVRRLVPTGHGKAMSDFMLSPQQTREFFEYAERVGARVEGVGVTVGCEDGIFAQNMHYFPRGCLCGYHSLTLLPNGYVYPCRRLPVLAGDLRKESLKDVYEKSDLLDDIRNVNYMNSECLACPFYNECLGGAKCISYAYWKKLGGPDPQCWRRFKELPPRNTKWNIPHREKRTVTYF